MATSPALMETAVPRPSSKPQPAAARTLPLPCLVPAVLSAAILWACFHPLAWGWLGWVALVPLLCLVRSQATARRIYLSAWLGGALFFVVALQWLRSADHWRSFPQYPMHGAWLALTAYCSLYFPLGVYLTRVLERRTRLPLVVTFPAVWVALEYLRSFVMEGFAWYQLAHTQHEFLAIIQVADLGGIFAVSLLVAAVNALCFDFLYQLPEVRAFLRLRQPPAGQRTFGDDWPELGNALFGTWRRGILIDLCAVTVLLGAAYVYGTWRLGQYAVRPGPIVALLQGNIDQRIREKASELRDNPNAVEIAKAEFQEMVREIGSHYQVLCELAHRCEPSPDLFIWPETSYPAGWIAASPELPVNQIPEELEFQEWRARRHFQDAFRPLQTPQLLGITTEFLDAKRKPHRYNSALLLDDKANPVGRYDKMHRVPFGEYVPLRETLPFMDWFSPYDYDYGVGRGEHFTRFKLGDFHFGTLICFEDTDPYLARHYVQTEEDGAPVDFLVNISNDGWFDGSCEHEEHLAVSRFRAIECRRAMVRAANMGISGLIDGNGRVLKADKPNVQEDLPLWSVRGVGGPVASMPQAEWSAFKKVSGVIIAAVPIDERMSPYVLLGDWLACLCLLVLGCGTVGTWLVARLRPAPAG